MCFVFVELWLGASSAKQLITKNIYNSVKIKTDICMQLHSRLSLELSGTARETDPVEETWVASIQPVPA